MTIEEVTAAFKATREMMASNISKYAVHPDRDFTRPPKKISPEELYNYLITEGGRSTKNEIIDVGLDPADPPSQCAVVRAREKLTPEGMEAFLREFNRQTYVPLPESAQGYRRLAFDGTRIIFHSDHRYAGEEYFIQTQPGIRGTFAMHGSFLYDLQSRTYTGGTIEPVNSYNEKDAFLKCIDNYEAPEGEKALFLADRNFESYNIIAHMIENGQYFIIRAKDVGSNGILRDIEVPKANCWDIRITIEITRSKSKKVKTSARYVRNLTSDRRFDFLEPRSLETYTMTFRAVRVRIEDGSYVCLLTNLPVRDFPGAALSQEYSGRWGEESSFREWKYTVGMLYFHAAQPELVMQEIWGSAIMYNVTELIAQDTAIVKAERIKSERTVWCYKANFSVCVGTCREYLRENRHCQGINAAGVRRARKLICEALIPIRPDRHFPRDMSKRVRKAKSFMYRVA